MTANIFNKKIIYFEELPSTNSKAKELATAKENEGTVVVAKIQKKGRGRFDRRWESPAGGLYLSTILRPKIPTKKTTLLPLVASLAVYDVLKSYGLNPKIKWPNDIIVNNKKIAGILLESEINDNELEYAILGIGINLNLDIKYFSKELKDNITSVYNELKETVDYQLFLNLLLTNLDRRYKTFIYKNFNKILNEWKQNSDTVGKKVKIITSTGEIIGIAKDIDQFGFLLVSTNSGKTEKITSGDCFYFDEI